VDFSVLRFFPIEFFLEASGLVGWHVLSFCLTILNIIIHSSSQTETV